MSDIPGWLMVMLLAMSPISELRGAIPLAIAYGYSPVEAYAISVLGNLIPVAPLLLFLGPVSSFLMRWPPGYRFFTWLFSRTRRKYIEGREGIGFAALMLFVAIPLPMTGAWTGCVLAFLLGFRFLPAFLAISLGVLIAGVIVTTAVSGAFALGHTIQMGI
ncbi:MAG: small multi-drug export protein [Methanothrix sp.]|uniref:COG2426 family protein n=1 Tax=Methanothrix sp. TaxID=90426 RepID=UPI0025E880A7|nr:small multi-drug export protein [Methanothrix sp.]MCQ8903328.1 small multi-drug export protein [Methanothrix sp.]